MVRCPVLEKKLTTLEAKWPCCNSPHLVVAIDPLQRQVVERLPPKAQQQERSSLCCIKRLLFWSAQNIKPILLSSLFILRRHDWFIWQIMTNHCKSKESWTTCPPVIKLITYHFRSCHSWAPPQLAMATLMCRIVTSHLAASKSCTARCLPGAGKWAKWIYCIRMQRSKNKHPSIPNYYCVTELQVGWSSQVAIFNHFGYSIPQLILRAL